MRWDSALFALVLLGGCQDSRTIRDPRDGGPGTGGDASALPSDAGPPPPPTDQLDLLFLIDNSDSMSEEQMALVAELPRFIAALVTGDHDGDGAPDTREFTSIQVGIISSDMGVGGYTVPSCVRADFGDDGVLRTQGRTDMPGCAGTYPNILAYVEGSGQTPEPFARDVGCVANMGTGGCGFEQQLEAVLKAVTPSRAESWTSPAFVPVGTVGAPFGLDRPFFRMTPPHGNVANDGFVRDDSLLAIVLLTDEEDCSAHDPELFDPASAAYAGTDLELRCFAHADAALQPIERYVRGLLQLRRHPSRLAFFPIAGLPADLAPAPGASIPWSLLVGDPSVRDGRMVEREDSTMPNRLVPSCDTARGVAFPPIRILRVAQGLENAGARVGIGSICPDSYAGALGSLLDLLSD